MLHIFVDVLAHSADIRGIYERSRIMNSKQVSRRNYLALVFRMTAASVALAAACSPNFVFILSDDQGCPFSPEPL